MKIALYIHCLIRGGTERMTTHLANFWSENGYEVSILCHTDIKPRAYSLGPKVKYVNMNVGGDSNNPVSAVINNVKIMRSLRRELKRIQPQYVISMAPTVNILTALASQGMKITRIGAEQNYPPAEGIGAQWELLRRYSYKYLDAVVAQTETTQQWLHENTNAKHVHVIHGPSIHPLERTEPVIQPDKLDKRKVILSVGRLTAQKQFDHLIKAFSSLKLDNPDWRLIILGEGELRKDLEELVLELGLSNSVYLPGATGNVGDWYEYSDIFALSSAYEGFPNVLIEALTHGLPAVCYDCDTGPRDMITPPSNGLLVPPNDIDELSSSLSQLMTNDDVRQEAGINARLISKQLDINSICKQWITTLEEAAERRGLKTLPLSKERSRCK